MLDALANREPWAKEAKDLLFLASCGKLDHIVTRNLEDHAQGDVPAISPHDYLVMNVAG